MKNILLLILCLLFFFIGQSWAQDVWDPEHMNVEEMKQKRDESPTHFSTRAPFHFTPWAMAIAIDKNNQLRFYLAGEHPININLRPWQDNDTLYLNLNTRLDTVSLVDTLGDTSNILVTLEPWICDIIKKSPDTLPDTLNLKLIISKDDLGNKSAQVDVVDSSWFMYIADLTKPPENAKIVLRFTGQDKRGVRKQIKKLQKNGYQIVQPLKKGWYILENESGDALIYLEPTTLAQRQKINKDYRGNAYVILSDQEKPTLSFSDAEVLYLVP